MTGIGPSKSHQQVKSLWLVQKTPFQLQKQAVHAHSMSRLGDIPLCCLPEYYNISANKTLFQERWMRW